MGRMSHLYFVGVVATTLCSGCPTQETSQRPQRWAATVESPAVSATANEVFAPETIAIALPSAEPQPEPEPEIAPAPEVENLGLKLCVVPAALEIDPTLLDIADAVAEYWTSVGMPVYHSTAEEGCKALLDVGERSLAKDGEWGFKEAQTLLPGKMSETNPAIVRFKLAFWTDPEEAVELKAALAAHEVGHVLLGAEHEPEATGKLMSPIVTIELAQELFAGRF